MALKKGDLQSAGQIVSGRGERWRRGRGGPVVEIAFGGGVERKQRAARSWQGQLAGHDETRGDIGNVVRQGDEIAGRLEAEGGVESLGMKGSFVSTPSTRKRGEVWQVSLLVGWKSRLWVVKPTCQ